jgi:hypothetical protein
MTHPVRIPADVDREDHIVANLTARQVLILALTGIVLYLAWTATHTVLPLAVFALLAVPVAAVAGILVLGQRDGLSLDRLLVAAIRQRTSPRHRINAPEGVVPPPAWLAARAASTAGDRRPAEGKAAAPLRLPARTVTTNAGVGVIDLGEDGLAVVAVASTVNLALRTPGEQDGLVAVFARYLHSLTAPVQILVRAMPADLSAQIGDLDDAAGQLPHPALAHAAREHATFLAQLSTEMQLLTRQVLLVLREPLVTAGPVDGLGGASPLAALTSRRTAARDARRAGEATRRAAHTRLARRLAEAVDLLAPAGIVLTPLDAGTATSVLAAACNPAGLVPPSALAAPDDVITADLDDPADSYPAYEPGYDDDGLPRDALGSTTRTATAGTAPSTPRTPTAGTRRPATGDQDDTKPEGGVGEPDEETNPTRGTLTSTRPVHPTGGYRRRGGVRAGRADHRPPPPGRRRGLPGHDGDHRLSAGGAPRLARPTADLPRPGRRRRARRADRPGHRGEPAAPPAVQAGVRPAARRRKRPADRPAGRGGDRGRLRPVRPRRPR